MNTADRSIALIEPPCAAGSASWMCARIQKCFTDILVNGIDIAKVLDTLNKRGHVLLDREHTNRAFLVLCLFAGNVGEYFDHLTCKVLVRLLKSVTVLLCRALCLERFGLNDIFTAPIIKTIGVNAAFLNNLNAM